MAVEMAHTFPSDFLWGTATASYQIEGSASVDGRGVSIWDTFSKTPGKVKNGDTGDIACDHYNRYPEDIALMQELGVKAYRFSIAWPRLFPAGDHLREERGFAFYNKLIDALLEAGIEPMVTLYHWDLPQSLEDQGGWGNRDTALAFADYAKACAEAFGDRVKNWITINEPWCVSWLGYSIGVHAPGRKDYRAAVGAAHHTALAHGLATRAIKSVDSLAKVGITVNMTNYVNENPEDDSLHEVVDLLDGNLNRWWIGGIEEGAYPTTLIAAYGDLVNGLIHEGDMELVKCDNDFLGVNYYSDSFVRSARPGDKPFRESAYLPLDVRANTSIPERFNGKLTDIGWPVTPHGLGELVLRIHRDWPQISAINITENGCAVNDEPDANGVVNDSRRVEYLKAHLAALSEAISLGAPVKAYFAWSLLDNYEWAEGYSQRFGIVHVDYATQKRTIKVSGHEFKKIVASNSVTS
jgi:beta-glucosidase